MTDDALITAYVELSQAKARYCRFVDTRDWNSLLKLLTPDVEFGIGDVDTEPDMIIGREQTGALLQSLVAGAKTAHHVHSLELELDGDVAQVVWAVQDRAVFETGLSVTGYGHYFERWVKDSGLWRLASLKLIHLVLDIDQK